MNAATAKTDTWYGHLDSIDADLASILEDEGFRSVDDLYDGIGPNGGPGVFLILHVGEAAAVRIAEELAPVC